MSAVSERTAEPRRPGIREVVVDFSAAEVKAPILLRCGALIIDYIVVVAIPVIGLLLSRFAGNDGANLLNDGLNNAGWLVAILVGVTNIVLVPMYSGQSLGKIVTGIRIVNSDGTAPAIGQIALRQTFGYLLTLASGGLGFISSFFGSRGRALHDLIAGTVVIYADRRVRR
jgi:uncharacterized RDD family membrane protein YckC